MNKTPPHLIIFDFSGLLSLAAVEFGPSKNLGPALQQSGLVAMGVSSEAFFWDEIVYPTWVEGGTTTRGYNAVLVVRILDLGLHVPGDPNPRESIQYAVSHLLHRYFEQCGTCLRDYIHVADLADGHVRALDYLARGGASTAINLGTGRAFSVREVIGAAERVTGRRIPVHEAPRQEGDPPVLVADATRARQVLGFAPQFTAIEPIVATAWRWHERRVRGR